MKSMCTFFIVRIIMVLPLFFFGTSCKKLVTVDAPTTSLNSGNVFTSDQTAAAVLTNLYASMSLANRDLRNSDITSISFYCSLSADELALYNVNNQSYLSFFRNNLDKTVQPFFWNAIYSKIFICNMAIEKLNETTQISVQVKKQLVGEAKFMRAFFYFYLVNMYGDVPLVVSTDYKTNSLLTRAQTQNVYNQIITDLKDAKLSLSEKYLQGDASSVYAPGSEERVRPTKWAASALLARTYLFKGDYANAETEATSLIDNSAIFKIETLDNVFKKNNAEAIWQLQPVGINSNSNTGEGVLYVLPSSGPNTGRNPVYLGQNLVNSFEINDSRRNKWIDSVTVSGIKYLYSAKYKIGYVNTSTQEYPTVLRLAEQYLIRAEARAKQGNLQGAIDDVNLIRLRHGSLTTPLPLPASQTSAINTIVHERQVELFTEWGHRWFDLKRWNLIDSVMTIATNLKGGSWHSYQSQFPIPQYEIDKDPNLTQNPGY